MCIRHETVVGRPVGYRTLFAWVRARSSSVKAFGSMALGVGHDPTTASLTDSCSTYFELPQNDSAGCGRIRSRSILDVHLGGHGLRTTLLYWWDYRRKNRLDQETVREGCSSSSSRRGSLPPPPGHHFRTPLRPTPGCWIHPSDAGCSGR